MGNLNEAKKSLTERIRRREDDAYLRRESLRTHDDYAEAESALQSLRFELARRKAENREFGELESDIRAAEFDYGKALSRYGQCAEDLNPAPLCPVCNDALTVNGAPCKCVFAEMKRLNRNSELRPPEQATDFPDDFPGCDAAAEQHNRSAAQLVKRWTDSFPKLLKPNLILAGKTGVGKTLLASVAANRVDLGDFTTLFLNAQRLNELFLTAHLAPLSEKPNVLSAVYEADLLVVDDLGAESLLQKVTQEHLYTLLSVRAGKPMIVTTNLTPAALRERYGERVFSRLFDRKTSLLVELIGIDQRLRPQ